MLIAAKVSTRGQVVIPKQLREALGIGPGDELLMVRSGDRIIVMKKPGSFVEALQGLGKEIWEGVEAVEYVREMRRDRSEED